jgi:hypothetical protein
MPTDSGHRRSQQRIPAAPLIDAPTHRASDERARPAQPQTNVWFSGKIFLPIKSSYPHFSRWLRDPNIRKISEDERFNLPRFFLRPQQGKPAPASGSAARSSFRITSVVGFAVCPLPVTFLTRSEAREKTELYTYQRLHIR